MRNGDEFFDDIEKLNEEKIVLVGEFFYIQLFLDYNLLKQKNVRIVSSNRTFWSTTIKIEYLDKIPSDNSVVIFCGLEKVRNPELMDYNFFDMKSVKDNGTFTYKREQYIVDDVKYVASNPQYMKRAYPLIKENELEEYLLELSRTPAERRIDYNGQICLYDFNGEYIHQHRGRRITTHIPELVDKRLHIFGDSRVSGYMIEDKDLFSNILQEKLNNDNKAIEVINYGIPGRDVERMFYQVEKANIKSGDIVFVLTACHEYREFAIEKQKVFAMYLKKIKEICKSKGAFFCFFNLPTTVEIKYPNNDEMIITDIYHRYKFYEYSYEVVCYYKQLLFNFLAEYEIPCIDIVNYFNENRNELLFINMHHYSPKGNDILALCLHEKIKTYGISVNDDICKDIYSSLYNKHDKWVINEIKNRELDYDFEFSLLDVKYSKEMLHKAQVIENKTRDGVMQSKGAIVMNANPFTKGHRYLAEYASSKVDILYIFVLSEDKSAICFNDRISMVYLGTKDLKNVIVLPSGKEIISDTTFPEYFMKTDLQDSKIDAYKDISSFAMRISIKYDIKYRFVGQEPFDKVTKQYNNQMKKYLPMFGIELVEIPRYELQGRVISATRVRESYEIGNWDEVEKFVPSSTLLYLKKLKNNE